MSNQAITWAYRQDITGGAKFVLVALADMADEAHSCFPGQQRLATMTGQTDRTVRRQLAELELAGFIRRQRRFDGAGHRTSDRYTLPVDADVLIPTGQNDHRSDQPPVTETAGLSVHRSNKPPVAKSIPTGQKDRVSLREPPATPQPPARGGPRSSWPCTRHTKRRNGCADCDSAVAAIVERELAHERRRTTAVLAEIAAAKARSAPRPSGVGRTQRETG